MKSSITILFLIFFISFNFPLKIYAQDNKWSVPSSWDVVEQDITFESSGVKLAGTLYSPKSAQYGPAVIVVQQASTETRDNPMFVQIAQIFNSIGYSVFLYDRRGKGESEGENTRPRYKRMAEDAVAAKRAIGETEEVHPDKIGYWGISQSGWLALEAATISDPAFVISVSSPLTTPVEQMEILSYNYILSRYNQEAATRGLEARRIVMNKYFRGETSYDSARAVLADIENEPWFEYAFMPPADQLQENLEGTSWINEMNYNPVPAYQKVEAPMLFILGGEDMDIPVKRTLDIIEELDSNSQREIIVIPGANHLMRVGDDPSEEYNQEDGPILSNSNKYFMIMGAWVGSLNLHK